MRPDAPGDAQQLEQAEERERRGEAEQARELLVGLVDAVDAGSDVRLITRCHDLSTRLEDAELALHFALCLWCARPGWATGQRAVVGAAMFHPERRVAGAGYRIHLHRGRSADWHAIATGDPYAAWPRIADTCAPGAPQTLRDLRRVEALRPLGAETAGAWALTGARLTRTGSSVVVGACEGGPAGRPRFVPALSVWDPSATVRWERRPTENWGRLGLLATRFRFAGYWHWLMEGLVHAVRLDEAGSLASLDRLVVCVDGSPPSFVPESLDAVGIPASKVSMRSGSFDLYASELVVPMRAPGTGGLIDEDDANLSLRENILERARYRSDADIRAVRRRLDLGDGTRARGSRRLFVSRRDAAKRRVDNEEELLAGLVKLGFEVVIPGALSFAEQVAVFAEADVVVGPHGAGLANALFMAEGSAMLELHHPDFGRPYYQRLSGVIGVRYLDLDCAPAPGSPRDMVADVDRVTAAVRALLSL